MQSKHIYIERRASPRRPYETVLEFIKLDSSGKRVIATAKSLNISSGGIAVITEFCIMPGQVLIYKEMHSEGELHFVTVAWTQKIENGYLAGMKYI